MPQNKLLIDLTKVIKAPNKQVKLNPQLMAKILNYDINYIFTLLTELYWDFKLRHFFGPDSYIPTIQDRYWRITMYSENYNPPPKPKCKRRNMASQQLARIRTIKNRGNTCEWCSYPGYIELHHIVEVVNGGTFEDNNLLLLCEKCHADAHGWNKKKYLDPHRLSWNGGIA